MLWSKEPDIIAALEVGSQSVVAAVAELREDGSMVLLGVGESKSAGVRKGEVVDFQMARQAIHQALIEAEKQTEVEIREVYLAMTGGHIGSRTVQVSTIVDNDNRLVSEEEMGDLELIALEQPVPAGNVIMHELVQNYTLDHQTETRDPIGLMAHTLEANYHIIYGQQNRLETTVLCINEMDVQVRGFALAALASAHSVLSREDKELGSVVIDMGAGTTDYVVYHNGAVVHTGVLAVGGDHLTQDLSLGLKLPFARAEKLKIHHGHLFMDSYDREEQLTLDRDASFEERDIYRESMSLILRLREEEVFNCIYEDLNSKGLWTGISGKVYLTGGGSQLHGVDRLANKIFPVPTEAIKSFNFDGDQTYSRRPDLATVMGLLRYAQRTDSSLKMRKGWAGFKESINGVLSSMRLF